MRTRAEPVFVYDRVARSYAKALKHELDGKPFDRDLIDRFCAALPAGASVADLGCGSGHVTHHLDARTARAVGIDISPAMIDEARRRFPSTAFEVGDLMALGHEDGSWDGLVAMFAFIHVAPEDLPRAFREAHRVLRPGGGLLLACHRGCGDLRAEHWLGRDVSLHCHLYEPVDLVRALEAAGFMIREQHVRPPYPTEHPSDRVYVWANRSKASSEPDRGGIGACRV